jgi:hypothetical protein
MQVLIISIDWVPWLDHDIINAKFVDRHESWL